MTGWRDELEALIRADLPAAVADAFAQLPLRPALQLSAAGPADPVVGQLGGAARLPVDMPWPVLRGQPLWLVASLDCTALAAYEVDLDLPKGGSLLFFLPGLEDMLIIDDVMPPVIYVPDGILTAEQEFPVAHRRGPLEDHDYPLVPLTGRTVASAPGAFNPALGADLESIRAVSDPLWHQQYDGVSVERVIRRYRGHSPDHQVGGYSDAFQHPLEISAAYAARRSPMGSDLYGDPAFLAEAREWLTLLQIDEDTDAGMIWGDGAIVLWAIRREDLARRDFGAVHFAIDGH